MTPLRESRALDVLAFAFLYAQLVATLWLVPEWPLAHLREPVHIAAVAAVVTTLGITLLRLLGPRGSIPERWTLALCLGGMPIVYVWSWQRSPQPGWLGIELAGLALFGGLAALGLLRSAWWLAAGIAGHGLFWDLWHHGRTTFIPAWYTVACLVIDIGLGVYAAVEAPRFRDVRFARLPRGS